MSAKILILGGTAEAAELASQLHEQGCDVITSLAGSTNQPQPVSGKIRIGGFGGAEKMAAWLTENKITRLIDATHPFATRISRNAVRAAQLVNIELEQKHRPAWQKQAGDNWTEVADLAEAATAICEQGRVFLALGSKHLGDFHPPDTAFFVIRMIDPPKTPLPFKHYEILIGKPSQDWQQEARLFEQYRITQLVCRNSGGNGAFAKIEAARNMNLPVIMVQRNP